MPAPNYDQDFRVVDDTTYESNYGYTVKLENRYTHAAHGRQTWDRFLWANKSDLRRLCNALQRYLVENP
jgi:hypothetical protein